MAKKIRFPLQMNGADVRTIEELRENFDLESVLGYFANGKLVTWLKDRYYDNEAMAVEALSAADGGLNRKLMSILGVPIDEDAEEIDIEAIQRRNEKLMLLRQITDDKEIIDNVDCVAFNQDELYDILDEGVETIYLCQAEFEVPLTVKNRCYMGLGNPTVKLHQTESMNTDLDTLNIKFKNVCFSDDVESKLREKLCEVDAVVEEETLNYEKAAQLIEEYKSKLITSPSFFLATNIFITRDFHGKNSYFSDHITSRDSLINTIRSHIQRPYENRRSEVEKQSKDNADTLIKYSIYDKVNGNFYHDSVEEISKALQELIRQLQDLGISVTDSMQTLDINYTDYPSISYQEIIRRLNDDVVRTGSGYSIYDYIESYGNIQSNTSTQYVRGLFGGMNKEVTTYDCGNGEFYIVGKIGEDTERLYKQNCEALEREIRSYVDRFIQYINNLYLSRLNEIQKVIESQHS